MLSTAAKNIIIYALKIRRGQGEDVEEILKGYRNLTDAEKYEGYDLPNFDSGQLTFVTNYGGMQAPFDFTRYTRVNFEIHKTAKLSNSYISIRDLNNKVTYAKVGLDDTLNVTQTVSIALNTMAINSFFGFEFASWRGAVYRIWAS